MYTEHEKCSMLLILLSTVTVPFQENITLELPTSL